MKTKFTKKDFIHALKVRMNSAMIEKHFFDEVLMDGNMTEMQYKRELETILQDLKSLVEKL